MNAPDLDLHLLAQLLVQRTERLVHQQQPRAGNERARHGDPLLLSARELARIARPRCASCTRVSISLHALARGAARQRAAHAQRKAHVLRNAHMREQRVGLKHHADVALVRRDSGDGGAIEQDLAGIGGEKAGDQIEHRGLARAARPEQRHECSGGDCERDVVDRLGRAERLAQRAQLDLGATRVRSRMSLAPSGATSREGSSGPPSPRSYGERVGVRGSCPAMVRSTVAISQFYTITA